MEKFLPIVLGTDNNSYTVARSIHSGYNLKPTIVGSAVLIPFYKSVIADVHVESNFSTDSSVFVSLLNRVYHKNKAHYEKFVIFAPTETYLKLLYDNVSKLDFKPLLPYPEKDLALNVMVKKNFYSRMEELNIKVPKTYQVNRENYHDFNAEGEFFLKADDYDYFNRFEFDGKQKGYYAADKDTAKMYLEKIYDSDFDGSILIQSFIHGDDGTEYSVNGYRSKGDHFTMTQARSLLEDPRPMWIGNHLVLSDSNRKDLYKISEEIIRGLGYYGYFNLDFKIDAKTNEVYVFELNTRLARSFYYSNLGGVNYIEVAIADLVYNEGLVQKQTEPFNWIVISESTSYGYLSPQLKEIFNQKDRLRNTGNSLVYDKDMQFSRKMKLKSYHKNLESQIIAGFNEQKRSKQ